MLRRTLILVLAAAASTMALAVPPKIHVSTGRSGVTFRHFAFALTPSNTILPRDSRVSREPLDEHAEQFKYGQFELFVPVAALKLPSSCGKYFILRMPQTLDVSAAREIQSKQKLFREISQMVDGRTGSVRVVLDYPEGCNVFFRSGKDGEYLNYVGQLKK